MNLSKMGKPTKLRKIRLLLAIEDTNRSYANFMIQNIHNPARKGVHAHSLMETMKCRKMISK